MNRLALRSMLACTLLIGTLVAGTAQAATPSLHWYHHLDQQRFDQARREHKFVLLDLHAVWCHWCHVMDDKTYADPAVRRELKQHYVLVSVDADSDPALTARYENWGWPATIVFAADGSEIVKRRGYLPPPMMLSMLKAIVADPSPGPSVLPTPHIASAAGDRLDAAAKKELAANFDQAYDSATGGWGDLDKYIPAQAMELLLHRARDGDARATKRAQQTLDANRKLIDPVWGGVYQYSDKLDWSSPHYEKLMSFQADDLRLYAEAWALWHRKTDLQAAEAIEHYMTHFLRGPDGAFYVSQSADLSRKVPGQRYYALDDAQRRALGMPSIDRHRYARENGWAIVALCKFRDVTGRAAPLRDALESARWVIAHRALPGGGFRHGSQDRGPYLDDNVAMLRAFLALARSTGDRGWLHRADAVLGFIDRHFRDARGGFAAAMPPAHAIGVFRHAVRRVSENVALARAADRLWHETGDPKQRAIANHAMRYLTAPALLKSHPFAPGILLANEELSRAPVHIAVIGAHTSAAARALHAAALRFPAHDLQVDWYDSASAVPKKSEIQYPKLPRPAAFACAGRACSSPIYKPARIATVVEGLRSTQQRQAATGH